MEVQMLHLLPCVPTHVSNYPIPTLCNPHLFNHMHNIMQKFTHYRLIVSHHISQRNNVFLWYTNQVHPRLRRNIPKEQGVTSVVHHIHWRPPRYYPAKNAIFHNSCLIKYSTTLAD